ncbi:MAG TPA: prolyl oligopeptidase family serine peptidase [Candidatus Polarisedimenticolia bacterium]|nr:prolyl oligopeptidase family serine peptidase [Candidatus Polarisedimenticolia bacterium]
MTRAEDIVDEIHGTRVADPYRWLEDGRGEEVRLWVEAQNAYTRSFLDARPGREAVRNRLTSLLSIGTLTSPVPRSGRYFYTRREGSQNQPILYVRDSVKGKDRVLLDPNGLSADGTAAIDWWYPTEDGRLLAYGVSTSGDEKSTLRIIEVATGRELGDVIPNTRYCALGWLPDNSGFYYTRYPAAGEVPPGQENYNRHVFFHRLGSDWTKDPKVFGETRRPEEIIELNVSPDGAWMTLWVLEGWSRSDLYVKDLRQEGSPIVPVAEGIDALFQGEVVEGTLYLLTNWEAPRYRLFAVDPKRPQRENWRLLIPESDAVLSEAHYASGRIVALYLKDASSRLAVHGAADGKKLKDIALPTLGSIEGVGAQHNGEEAFFEFDSFTVPPSVFRIDLKTGAATPWEGVKADLDLKAFEVEQVFYPSKDGTKISMFLVHRKGLRRDGRNAVVLYGYGGFNISMTPSFSRALVLWLERGGVYAVANLRGGGEYGEEWHRAGMLDRKQNVFDDYLAAAQWLIAKKYTGADRLGIYGGSNGGLLVGAALTQKPELFRAVVCAVPLLDMVRYHNFQIAKLWVPEYGSAEDAAQFRFLYAYSPYHRVREKTAYPAVLLTTAESDSRVDPMHARKMAALLQKSTSSGRPILLRTETKAGHGIGKPLTKQIDEATDTWSFLMWQLGLEGAAARQEPAPAAR